MIQPVATSVDLSTFQTRVLDEPPPGRRPVTMGVALDDRFVYTTHYWADLAQPASSPERGTLRVLNKGDLSEAGRITVGHQPRRVAVDAARRRAYVANRHQSSVSVSIVDLDAGAQLHEVVIGASPVDVAVDTVRNQVFVTAPQAQAVYVIDPDPPLGIEPFAQKIPVGLGANGVAVDDRDGRVYVTRNARLADAPWIGVLTILHPTDSGYAVELEEAVDPAFCLPELVTVDPLARRAYVGCLGGAAGTVPQVAVFNLPDGTSASPLRRGRFDVRWDARGMGVDQSLNLLYVAQESAVQAFELSSRKLAGMIGIGGHLNGLVVDPASSQVYVADDTGGSITRIVPRPLLAADPRAPVGAVPAAAVNNDRWSVFVVSEDRAVRASHWRDSGWLQPDGTVPDWSPWQRVDGATFPPGAPLASLSRSPGRWDLIGVDDGGRLRGVSGIDGTPDAWRDLLGGLPPGGHVALLARRPEFVTAFAVAADGHVHSGGWDDAGTIATDLDHGGTFPPGAPLAVVSRKPDHWDLFVVDGAGQVWTQWWSTGAGELSPWGSLGGGPFPADARISALGRKSDQLDLFAVGTDGQVWTAFWNDEHGWSAWGSLGGNFPPGSPVAALATSPDVIDLFVTGPDQQVYTAWWMKDPGWSAWDPVGGLVSRPGAPLGVASVNVDPGIKSMPNVTNVVWTAPGGAVETGWWSEIQGGWSMDRGIRRRISTPMRHWSAPTGNSDDNLRGSLNVSAWSDGSYQVRGHIRNSGFDPHRFVSQAAIVLRDGELALPAYHRGRADGSGSDLDPDRDHDWMQLGSEYMVEQYFASLVNAKMLLSFSNKNIGLGGGVTSLLNEVLGGFLIGALSLSPGVGQLAAAVGIGGEILELIGGDLGDVVPVEGLAGLVTAGGILFVLGPGALLPAVAAGVAVGAQVKHREMRQDEADFAAAVFGATLPPPDQIVITNLHGFAGKLFVVPYGGKILLNFGRFWDETLTATWPEERFDEPGQLFVHELMHVWQIAHRSASFSGWVACGALTQAFGSKDEPSPTASWDPLNIEQQAIIVDHWYARNHQSGLTSKDALADPYFHFIRDHVRNLG